MVGKNLKNFCHWVISLSMCTNLRYLFQKHPVYVYIKYISTHIQHYQHIYPQFVLHFFQYYLIID